MTRRLPEGAVARAALGGGDAEVDALARAWLPIVHAWCARLGGPAVDAEDAAHEALLAMCRNLGRVTDPDGFPAWLFAICRKTVANHRRRAWVRRWMPGVAVEAVYSGWSPERTAEARQTAALVWRALDELPAAQREVLVLCELEERPGSEAAELLGIPLGTVRSRLRLARDAFRAALVARGAVVDLETIAAEVV